MFGRATIRLGIGPHSSIANVSLSLTVTKLGKSVKILQSYRHEFGGPSFLEHSVVFSDVLLTMI